MLVQRHFAYLSRSVVRRPQLRKNYSSEALDNIVLKKIKQTDCQQLTEFLLKNFYRHEPMGVVLGLDVEKEVGCWLHKWVKAHLVLSPPVSTQAIDTKTGKIVGVQFSSVSDPKRPSPPLQIDFVDSKRQPIKAQICRFLDEIEEGIDAAEFLGLKSLSSSEGVSPKTLDNLMISVNNEYWQRGLSVQLIKNTEEYAVKVKDCVAAKSVVTSEWSYRAFLKREYQMIREFQFERYRDAEDVHIFKGKELQLGRHTSARVMIKDLTSMLPPSSKSKHKKKD